MRQATVVESFRKLHSGDRVLVLPNAWDAASAALFKAAGASAIATSSGAVSWAFGYADGDRLPQTHLRFALEAICRVSAPLPVSADIESGFSDDPGRVAALVDELRAAGIAGINLEDGDRDPQLLVDKIAAIRKHASAGGYDVFVNARPDVFLLDLATGDHAVTETIARARRYRDAGADAIFVPGLNDTAAMRSIAQAIDAPLGILALPGLPPLPTLYEIGVRRITLGVRIALAAYGVASHLAARFLESGSLPTTFNEYATRYDHMNELFIDERVG